MELLKTFTTYNYDAYLLNEYPDRAKDKYEVRLINLPQNKIVKSVFFDSLTDASYYFDGQIFGLQGV